MWQYSRVRAVIQIVNVNDLRVCILNVRYGETKSVRRLGCPEEASYRNGKCNRHCRLIGSEAFFR